MSSDEDIYDPAKAYEDLECLKLNKKARDKNWVPLILPLGCPGKALTDQLTSIQSWMDWTHIVFEIEAEPTECAPFLLSCDVTKAELFYIDASFVDGT